MRGAKILLSRHFARQSRCIMSSVQSCRSDQKSTVKLHDKVQNAWSEQGKGSSYDDYRPNYHQSTIEYITKLLLSNTVDHKPHYNVLELGAGTGKFTRKMVEALNRVHLKGGEGAGKVYVAVEPLPELSGTLVATLPPCDTVELLVHHCAAESLQAEDNSAQCVICPQSFHWFANAAALTEIHRVLAPGGLLVLVWNSRDVSDPVVKALDDIYLEFYRDRQTPRQGDNAWKTLFHNEPRFTALQQHVQHVLKHKGDKDFIVNYMATISVISSLAPDDKDKTLRRVRQVLDEKLPPGTHTVSLPLYTEIYHCTKL